jgi:hypothetical protein
MFTQPTWQSFDSMRRFCCALLIVSLAYSSSISVEERLTALVAGIKSELLFSEFNIVVIKDAIPDIVSRKKISQTETEILEAMKALESIVKSDTQDISSTATLCTKIFEKLRSYQTRLERDGIHTESRVGTKVAEMLTAWKKLEVGAKVLQALLKQRELLQTTLAPSEEHRDEGIETTTGSVETVVDITTSSIQHEEIGTTTVEVIPTVTANVGKKQRPSKTVRVKLEETTTKAPPSSVPLNNKWSKGRDLLSLLRGEPIRQDLKPKDESVSDEPVRAVKIPEKGLNPVQVSSEKLKFGSFASNLSAERTHQINPEIKEHESIKIDNPLKFGDFPSSNQESSPTEQIEVQSTQTVIEPTVSDPLSEDVEFNEPHDSVVESIADEVLDHKPVDGIDSEHFVEPIVPIVSQIRFISDQLNILASQLDPLFLQACMVAPDANVHGRLQACSVHTFHARIALDQLRIATAYLSGYLDMEGGYQPES